MATCLEYNGFKYWKRQTRNNKVYYTCSNYRKTNCCARLISTVNSDNNSLRVIGVHSCSVKESLREYCSEMSEMDASERDIRFKHPCTTLVAGPTGCGKTVLVRKILQDHAYLFDNINTPELKVTWCYGQWQTSYSHPVANVQVDYVEGLVDQEYVVNNKPHLIVVDDLMTELGGNKELANLFTKGSHHLNISVIFILQNIFHQATQMRTISLNSHYMILLKNPRDKSQIVSLARQLYPTNMKFLQEVYKDATSRPFGYLLLDLTPDTPEELRCRSLILPSDVPSMYKSKSAICPIVYQEDGAGGRFSKSYSLISESMTQKGGRAVPQSQRLSDNAGHHEILIKSKPIEQVKRSSNDLRHCLSRLDVAARTKDVRRRKTLLRELAHDAKITDTLRTLAQNTINMRIPLEKHHKVKLLRHNAVIKGLAKNRISKTKYRLLVEQSGGFLQTLIPIAIELVSDLLEECE